ncbi:hypothetical protein MAHJHV29_48270 [Mycobacterium avium subsp. hominissuis]
MVHINDIRLARLACSAPGRLWHPMLIRTGPSSSTVQRTWWTPRAWAGPDPARP